MKRLIGRRFTDKVVQNDLKRWPFKVFLGEGGKAQISIHYKGEYKVFFPEEISSMVLVKMKETVKTYLGTEVKNAVVTVPAYFNDSQRQATKDAGTIAGLNVLQIINESTAAAISYCLLKHDTNSDAKGRNILVFDLGGGTFDVSLVIVADGSFAVKATCGDTHLGGVDFDNNMVEYFVLEFKRDHSKDIRGNHRALERLRFACEKAKKSLSSIISTTIEVDCLYDGIDFFYTISRDKFEVLNMNLFEECIKAVEMCLRDANMKKNEVDDIVLVGGSTRIPKVQELLQTCFEGKELCKRLNADEAIANGAAIQAAILNGNWPNKHFTVSDVTPLCFSFKDSQDKMTTFIHRNTPIPKNMRLEYDNPSSEEECTSLEIYEGGRDDAEENHLLLGNFILRDKSDFIEFNIDANSIFTVISGETRLSEKSQMTIIEHGGSLSENKIAEMTEEAKKYKNEDINHKNVGEARCAVQVFVSNLEDILRSRGTNIKYKDKKQLQIIIQQTNTWLDSNQQQNDASKFKKKLTELQEHYGHLVDTRLSI